MTISATTDFDSGGGVDVTVDNAPNRVTLTVADEGTYGADGYFHVRLAGLAGETVSFEVSNLDDSRMPSDYRLAFTDDLAALDWHRFDGTVGGGFSHAFEEDVVHISNMNAYPYGRIVDRVTELDGRDFVETEVIGRSREGRDMHAIRVTDPEVPNAEKRDVVCNARQHPGEVQGSYHLDGAVDYVLDAFARDEPPFDEDYVFHFLPDANPDGIYRGYHRQDPRGDNLNREWQSETPVEISVLTEYLRDAVTDVAWGFDFHSTTNPDYGAATTYYADAADSDDLAVIEEIAARSRSMTGTDDRVGAGWHSGWIYTEFAALSAVTEVWTYDDRYTPDRLSREGRDFVRARFEK